MSDNKQGSNRLPPQVQMPSTIPPSAFEPSSAFDRQLPHEPIIWSPTNQNLDPPTGRPHVHLPVVQPPKSSSTVPEPRAQRSRQRDSKPQTDLESQLRGMIINNNGPPSSSTVIPSQGSRGPKSTVPSDTRTQTSHKRPNQAQRRQQAQGAWHGSTRTHDQALLTTASSSPWPPRSPVPQLYSQPSITQPNSLPYAKRSMERSNEELIEGHHNLQRPQPVSTEKRQRQIHVEAYQTQRLVIQAQINYLNRLACEEVSRVQISAIEYDEKQALRQRLETVCRSTVYSFESQNHPNFRPESVELKTFGSLSIGFATRDSDMDLVLVSPSSTPELGSPESPIPRLVEKALMDLGYGVRLLTQTRVPIIKFCEKPNLALSACLRMTRLYWEDEVEHFANSNSKDIAVKVLEHGEHEPIKPGATATDLSLAIAEKMVKVSQRSAEDAVIDAASFDDNAQKLHSTLDLADSRTTNESLNTPSSVASQSKSEKRKEKDTSVQTEDWLAIRASDHSNYSNEELAGICLRNARVKHNTKPEQLLMQQFVESIDIQRHPHQASEVENARRAVEAIPDLVKPHPLPSREELDFPKSGVGTQCDINFSSDLALQNSLLLKCYSLCDPRVRVVVLFVKAWTKIRKINSPYHGTLNSYGYVLMVLHYLINVSRPPVIPNLQLCSNLIKEDELSASETNLKGYNIQFFRNQSKIEEMARTGQITQNRESVGSLLRGFFHYYAQPSVGAFRWKDDVLSLRTPGGILTKAAKGWIGARTETVDLAGPGPSTKKVNHHYVLAIEDPFEIEHNVARTVFFNGIVAIRDEFRRAVSLITCAGSGPLRADQYFFAEGAKNENLQKFSNRPGRGRGHGAHGSNEKAKTAKNDQMVTEKEHSGATGNKESKAQQ